MKQSNRRLAIFVRDRDDGIVHYELCFGVDVKVGKRLKGLLNGEPEIGYACTGNFDSGQAYRSLPISDKQLPVN